MGVMGAETVVTVRVRVTRKRQVSFNTTSSTDSLHKNRILLKMPPSSKPLAVSKADPRGYIKPQPLPIPGQKGLRIQARSETTYNPASPTRDLVRKENYDRRRHQMRCQGFKSRPDKPYQGLGDPFYLDTKKLILHSLGQWDEGQQDTTSSSDSEDDTPLSTEDQNKKSATTGNFVLRRARKGLNTLSKEITRQRGLIRNVRLGHGLFQQLRKEREDRSNARHREEMRQRQQQLNEWQAPRYDTSSDDETDEDISDDVDLKSYMMSMATGELSDLDDQKSALPPGTDVPPGSAIPPGNAIPPGSAPGDLAGEHARSRVVFHGVVEKVGEPAEGQEETDNGTLAAPSEYARSVYAQSARSRTSRTSRASSRRKLPPARPYTPQHSYIGTEITDYPDRSSLFRQLCSLYWLLEAMNIESPVAMGPISKCWSLSDIGGVKTTVVKQHNEKKNETRWKQFVTNQVLRGVDGALESRRKKHRNSSINFGRDCGSPLQPGIGGKRNSLFRTSNRYRGRGSITGRNSVMSMASLSDSHTGFEHGSARGYHRGTTAIPEGSELSHEVETGTDVTEEEDLMPKGPLRYLDDSYDRELSTVDATSQQDVMSARSDRSSCVSPSTSPQLRRRYGGPTEPAYQRKTSASPAPLRRSAGPGISNPADLLTTQEEVQKFLDSITRSEEDPRFHALANPKEKMSSKDLRADLNVHPRITPAVQEYQASLPSNRVGRLAQEQRQKFAEVKQEKALMLHDALEAKDRQRLRVLQNKFLHMPTGGCSFHRALGSMRHRSANDEEQRERRRHSSTTHQAWYMELLNNVPEEMKREWYFQVILEKLLKYGLVDSTKQSAYKLLKVLSGLRDWEICCPDISAAIEFCRDKICEMTVDDFEEWFRSQFPTVLRPQTAPAANRNGKDKRAAEGTKKVPRSAPPGLTRTNPL